MKITDCSSASGPAGGLLTCWDKDVLVFCHWKIRACWQGRKHLGGVCWDRENHQCTAQHSFQPGQKKPHIWSTKYWLGFSPTQIHSCAGVKTVWAPHKWQITPQTRPTGWKAPAQGEPAGKKKKENSRCLVVSHNCPISHGFAPCWMN